MKFIKKWFKGNKGVIKFTLAVFIAWQVLIAIVISFGVKYFPTTNAYLYTEKKVVNPSWLWSRANFDGIHYLDIARKGYGIYQQAFFPLYPRLINLLTPFFNGQNLFAGWTISSISFLLLILVFYKLIRLDYKDSIAKRSVFYLLIFPTAFFFSMVYTESLFLLLVLSSFYAAKTKHWWWAGVFGALASATRLPGIFLFPALLVEWWQQNKISNVKTQMSNLIPLFLIPFGLLYYMRFLAIKYGDPLMFLNVQPFFGAGREVGKIVLLYQVFWRYLKMLVTVDKLTTTYFVVSLEFLTGVGFSILTIFIYLRRWFSYLTFMSLAYILPTITGTFISMPRFVLTLFPSFILLAIWGEKYRWVRVLYPIVAIPLLIISLLFFTRGYWIA